MGNTTQFWFDAAGNKVLEEDPLGHLAGWTYDADNRLIAQTDLDDRGKQFVYDPDNRLLQEKWTNRPAPW